MNKKKELEEIYFQGMIQNRWEMENGKFSGMFTVGPDYNYVRVVETLETEVYGRILNNKQCTQRVPFKNAVERFMEIYNSPLMNVLKEDE
jgi:hypothetical protein